MSGLVESILTRLGGPAVLLAIPYGEKGPHSSGWQNTTLADMERPDYLANLNRGGNIGVLLGDPSLGLCTIDLDEAVAQAAFLACNPTLATTLRTVRVRGGNIWVRVRGTFPASGKLKVHDTQTGEWRAVGEWRADGNQTVIHGSAMDPAKGETQPTAYRRVVDAPPAELASFAEIVWPADWRLPWHSESPPASATPPAVEADERIILPSGPQAILDCAERLFSRLAATRLMFARGGVPVELSAEGTLEVVRPPAFRSRIEAVARLFAWAKGPAGRAVLVPACCPEDIARALLASLPARDLLPPVAVVVRCPVAVEDANGNLRVLGRGYHPERGGLLVTAGELPPQVPLAEAVAALSALLDDFDFLTPADRSRALASFLSPALALGGWLDADSPGRPPVDVGEADKSQSGKGFRQKVNAAIFNETLRVVVQRNGGVGSLDESFSSALLDGRPFIQIDNVRGGFDSVFLESFLTADTAPARVPYHGEVRVEARRYYVMMSSNGVETTRDLANRSSIIRIRKRPDTYCFREFPEGDLLAHVRARQSYYLGCVFSVLAEWLGHSKPRTSVAGHDFRGWARTLDWIVQHVFQAAPLLDGHVAAQERVSDPARGFLRAVALAVAEARQLNEIFTASGLGELAEEHGVTVPGVRSDADERAKARHIGVLLARVFCEADTAEVDGFRVRRTERQEPRDDGNGNRALRAYEFQRL